MTRTTLKEVAEVCGVSRATVSLVIQDNPRVSDATKDRVRRVLAEMGYVYDRRAANLRSRQSSTIGLLLTDIKNPALADLAMSVEHEARTRDYVVFMGYSEDVLENQSRTLQMMIESRVDGVILSPTSETTVDDLVQLTRTGTPYVLVTRRVAGTTTSYVGTDNEAAGRVVAEHLVELGARTFAFLGGPQGTSPRIERTAGLKTAIEKAGLSWDDDLSIVTSATEAGGVQAARVLLERGPLPDALVCYSDVVAIGASTELSNRGVRVGVDVALTGFDNIANTAYLRPSLTTADSHLSTVGARAAELLFDHLEEPLLARPTVEVLPSELIVRESTAGWSASRSKRVPLHHIDGADEKRHARQP